MAQCEEDDPSGKSETEWLLYDDLLLTAITHIFLPKKLPDKGYKDEDEFRLNQLLLRISAACVSEAVMEAKIVELRTTKTMIENWEILQPKSLTCPEDIHFAESFSWEISTLENGHSIPIYVGKQNCTIIFTRTENKNIETATFRSTLPCKIIMSNIGHITMEFPETQDTITNKSHLQSTFFAKHLFHLATENSTDYNYREDSKEKYPGLVTEWLIGLLQPVELQTQNLKPTLKKKIRDQATTEYSYSHSPAFRRSGMWMSIKVTLHLKLVENFKKDYDTARVVYKIIMLRLMATVCSKYIDYCHKRKQRICIDLASQLMAKVGKRTEKLEKLMSSSFEESKTSPALKKKIQQMRTKCLEFVHRISSKMVKEMQLTWKLMIDSADQEMNGVDVYDNEETSSVGLHENNEEQNLKCTVRDLFHHIQWLDELVEKTKQDEEEIYKPGSLENLENVALKIDHADSPSEIDIASLIKMSTQRSFKSNQSFHQRWIIDTEDFFKGRLNTVQYEDIGKLFELYNIFKTETVDKQCSHNPIQFSEWVFQTILVMQHLDTLVTEKHPLVKEYKTGIPIAMCDHLILPEFDDLKLLNQACDYFSLRDIDAKYPCILESSSINADCLSVRFAKQDQLLLKLLEDILNEIDVHIKEKLEEVVDARESYNDVQTEMKSSGSEGCTCTYEDVCKKVNKQKVTQKVRVGAMCEVCYFESELNAIRHSVPPYTRPLPVDENLRLGIIFELRPPPELLYWRTILASINWGIFGVMRNLSIYKKSKKQQDPEWRNCKALSNRKSPYPAFMGKHKTVTLCSDKPSIADNKKDIFCDNMTESFILPNEMNCIYMSKCKYSHDCYFIEKCAFKIDNTSKYFPLQRFLENDKFSQNDVIASQHTCKESLSLNEFLTFGSIRAEQRLQMRSLFKAISSRNLSLENDSVLMLVLQTLWQVGPPDSSGTLECHLDFQDINFCCEFVNVLEEVVTENESNYSNPNILMITTVITTRIIEACRSSDCSGRCYSLLNKSRKILMYWSATIQKSMQQSAFEFGEAYGSRYVLDYKQQQNLHTIHLTMAMTFSGIKSLPFNNLVRTTDDVVCYLTAIAKLNSLGDSKICQKNIPHLSQRALYFIKEKLSKQLGIEQNESNETCPDVGCFLKDGIHQYICNNWEQAANLKCQIVAKNDSVILFEYAVEGEDEEEKDSEFVLLELCSGEVKVNGYVHSTLSTDVQHDSLFRKYFRLRTTDIAVRRVSETRFATTSLLHGRQYEFIIIEAPAVEYNKGKKKKYYRPTSTIYIKEITADGAKLTLIDGKNFKDLIPNKLVENYSHWLDSNNGVVYFRTIPAKTEHFLLPSQFTLKKVEGSGWQLLNNNSQHHIVSITSVSFHRLSDAFSRMEKRYKVQVEMNENTLTVQIEIPRFNLRFQLNQIDTEKFQSLEYPGYFLADDQTSAERGTLIGLSNGIILKNNSGEKMFLCPHGNPNINHNARNGQHQTVEIQIDETNQRQPPYFVYQFDTVLQSLRGRKCISSWLYLALLHGFTSSSMPDPFTGVTGTEMAIRILQNSFVWSPSPYDQESRATLQLIQKLSPTRSSYSLGDEISMEQTKWPDGSPSMAAFDGFDIIINKLIEDSERLEKLFPMSNQSKTQTASNFPYYHERESKNELRLRAYFRHLQFYNPAANIQFPKYFTQSLITSVNKQPNQHIISTREIRSVYRVNSAVKNICQIVMQNTSRPYAKGCLLQKIPQHHDPPIPAINMNSPPSWTNLKAKKLIDNWLKFYSLAIARQSEGDDEIKFYEVALQAVSYLNSEEDFEDTWEIFAIFILSHMGRICFPTVPTFEGVRYHHAWNLTETDFNVREIASLLQENHKQSNLYMEYSYFNWSLKTAEQKAAERRQIREDSFKIAKFIRQRYWPCAKIPFENISEEGVPNLHFELKSYLPCGFEDEINNNCEVWYKNRQLLVFLNEVEHKLIDGIANHIDIIKSYCESLLGSVQATFSPSSPTKSEICILKLSPAVGGHAILSPKSTEISNKEKIQIIFQTGRLPWESLNRSFEDKKTFVANSINEVLETLSALVQNENITDKIKCQTGIWYRMDPTTILSNFLQADQPLILQACAGALAVLWAYQKQFLNNNDNESTFQSSYEDWAPSLFPQWLLLQLELGIIIRRIQVDVAKHMMSIKNGVMQLNMGEGKTSVIVPMLCSLSVREEETLCRVTSLNSLFKSNQTLLSFAIGGLLNQRVYTFPCRRDFQIDKNYAVKIQQVYKECLENNGVVLTLPEHRLSFRLLAFDKMLKQDQAGLGLKMFKIESWLQRYSRDIMDESDELLEVKYQLVYTIGKQTSIDGGDIRWKFSQDIFSILLKSLPAIIRSIQDKTQIEIEYHPDFSKSKHPHEFPHFRLLSLDKTFLNTFNALLADEMLKHLGITGSLKNAATKLILEENLSPQDHSNLRAQFATKPALWNKILLLIGYIQRGVLSLALSKRWRVDYGVCEEKCFRRMAVPFRAKDVPAEKTEFGHPDLAILLTQLSYYYSGLSEAQLLESLELLKRKKGKGPDAIYSSWLQKISKERIPTSLSTFTSININDATQRSEIFQLLYKHKDVIDFWLNHHVYPKECRQFPSKIAMTPWDLCNDRHQKPICGFSGTNDSSILLPLSISQNDLPELRNTNAEMEEVLLREMNCMHRCLSLGVTCAEILTQMMADSLNVFIDAGALMLELSNEQIAKLWLEMDSNKEAVLYFKNEELFVKTATKENTGNDHEHNHDIPYELSSFQGRLENCGIFLDDQHTRGTDIKFPSGFKACVTLGGKMKKDKLIQSCMRMRQLGRGHSVSFYLSHEATAKINEMRNANEFEENRQITTEEVITWVKENTKEYNKSGLLHWAAAGKIYTQRMTAEDNFDGTEENAVTFAKQCVDPETQSLDQMYGQCQKISKFTEVVPMWFKAVKQKVELPNNINATPLSTNNKSRIDTNCQLICERIKDHAPEITHIVTDGNSMMLEEEQEKELEVEKQVQVTVEDERQLERPMEVRPNTSSLHPFVRELVVSGGPVTLQNGVIYRLPEIFCNTSFWNIVQPECWGEAEHIFATNDFLSPIHVDHKIPIDSYLRPIEYLAVFRSTTEKHQSVNQILLLSPFEAGELIPLFRIGATKCTLHMFSARTREKQDLLLNNQRLQLPYAPDASPLAPKDFIPLLLASGNLFFVNALEQKWFTNFLGVIPKPWSKIQQYFFQQGAILESGFVNPKYRREGWPKHCFQECPIELVMKILECRHHHEVMKQGVHIFVLTEEGRCVQLFQLTNGKVRSNDTENGKKRYSMNFKLQLNKR